jgi:type IV pilus assembly protein PilQ
VPFAHRFPKLLSPPFLAALVLALACSWVVPAPAADRERTVSLDATEADISNVLRILAEKGGFNLITGPNVSGGRITIRMKDVPVDQAINLVVRAAGLAYERIGNSILVASPQSLKEETGLSSYVVELKYANAEEVRAALQKLTPDIQVDKGGNRLIVVTSPRIISEIEEIVRVMDTPVQQVMLEARIIEVSTDDLKELGIDWDLLNRQGTVIVEGLPAPSPPQSPPGTLGYIPSSPGTRDFYKLRAVSRQAKAFQVAIDALIRDGNARVLANPKIATLNGKEATMLIGSRIPFVVQSTVFAGGGAAPTQEIQREEVGIKLRITPLINADGYITTEINPEVSSVVGFQGANNDLPVISTRQASTTIRLKDGNSVIIGGLLSEEKTVTTTRVPLLGQIPVIGAIFTHHRSTTNKKDLVIEVTPRILRDQG